MTIGEDFSEKRMQRCAAIQGAIMENWKRTNRLDYTVRLTEEPGPSLSLSDLRKAYFSVGVGDNLTDVPFVDVLVIFTMIEQETLAWRNAQGKKLAKEVHVRLEIPTQFSEDETARLLGLIQFQLPGGKRIRLSEAPRPPADESDQQNET